MVGGGKEPNLCPTERLIDNLVGLPANLIKLCLAERVK